MSDEIKQIYIWPDFSASGIWVPDEEGAMVCYDYSSFDFSPELLQRFKYWMEWYDKQSVLMSDAENKMDWDLFHSYGKSIATEVKLLFRDKYQVFYGYANDKDHVEILLENRINYGGMVVPISKRKS